jgi:hypothetical protein
VIEKNAEESKAAKKIKPEVALHERIYPPEERLVKYLRRISVADALN